MRLSLQTATCSAIESASSTSMPRYLTVLSISFGRYAAGRRAERGQGKPETFDFLGLTHYCNTRKNGAGFQLGRKTQRKRLKAKLREIKETLRRRIRRLTSRDGGSGHDERPFSPTSFPHKR